MTTRRSLAIIGAGKIGQAVGSLWIHSGHSVYFGSRFPENLSTLVAELGERASAVSIAEAAAVGEVALLAIPYEALDEVIPVVPPHLEGKIVLDATNPFALSPEGHIVSALPAGVTAGSRMAELLPNSLIVRASSHVMDELLVSRGVSQSGLWAMAIAGDDAEAKQIASGLVRDAGYVAADIGALDESGPLDPGGFLFPHMFTVPDMLVALTLCIEQ